MRALYSDKLNGSPHVAELLERLVEIEFLTNERRVFEETGGRWKVAA